MGIVIVNVNIIAFNYRTLCYQTLERPSGTRRTANSVSILKCRSAVEIVHCSDNPCARAFCFVCLERYIVPVLRITYRQHLPRLVSAASIYAIEVRDWKRSPSVECCYGVVSLVYVLLDLIPVHLCTNNNSNLIIGVDAHYNLLKVIPSRRSSVHRTLTPPSTYKARSQQFIHLMELHNRSQCAELLCVTSMDNN